MPIMLLSRVGVPIQSAEKQTQENLVGITDDLKEMPCSAYNYPGIEA